MRLIDADELMEHLFKGIDYDRVCSDGVEKTEELVYAYKVGWNEAIKAMAKLAPTVDAVPLEDYKSMEQTVNKLTKAIADAEPVRHGHWCVTQAYPHTVYCSECFQRFAQAHWAVWEDGSLPRDYCPNCGAKMDEVEDG